MLRLAAVLGLVTLAAGCSAAAAPAVVAPTVAPTPVTPPTARSDAPNTARDPGPASDTPAAALADSANALAVASDRASTPPNSARPAAVASAADAPAPTGARAAADGIASGAATNPAPDPAADGTVPGTANPAPDPAADTTAAGTTSSNPAPDPASDGTVPGTANPAPDPACDGTLRPDPLPAPGTPRAQDFFRSFREPLAPAPLYDPPGPRRVGLQAGHWLTDQVPPELGRLQAGAVGGGKAEWEVNLDVAQRTAARLQAASIDVDLLPSTIPPRYRANAFIALHADGDPAGQARGFKVARPGFSSLPSVDDRLVDTLNQVYAADTELPRDDEHISLRMRYYYAFNSRRYCHAVAPGVPQAIVEMAYLTSAVDRQWLVGDPDRLAHALADAIQTFLATLP